MTAEGEVHGTENGDIVEGEASSRTPGATLRNFSREILRLQVSGLSGKKLFMALWGTVSGLCLYFGIVFRK